jgi:hypothetical protein
MAQIVIDGLTPAALRHLQAQARQHGRSMEAEARILIEQGLVSVVLPSLEPTPAVAWPVGTPVYSDAPPLHLPDPPASQSLLEDRH